MKLPSALQAHQNGAHDVRSSHTHTLHQSGPSIRISSSSFARSSGDISVAEPMRDCSTSVARARENLILTLSMFERTS